MFYCDIFFSSITRFKGLLVIEIQAERALKALTPEAIDRFCCFGTEGGLPSVSAFEANSRLLVSRHLSCLYTLFNLDVLAKHVSQQLKSNATLLDLVYAEMLREKVSITKNDKDFLPSAAAFAYAHCLMEMDHA